jgi:hypothetical protein
MKLGALALGAAAAGASAYGAVAVARLAIGRAAIKRLEIAELLLTRTQSCTTPRARYLTQRFPSSTARTTFLDAFQRLGRYLEDLSPLPVSHLDLQYREQRRERRALRAEGIKPLARRMKPRSPLVVVPVVLDMVKTGDIVNTLRLATQVEVERADLPFSGRHRHCYVRELTDHIRSWRRRRILLPL